MSRIGRYALFAALPLLSDCASVIPEAGGARPGTAPPSAPPTAQQPSPAPSGPTRPYQPRPSTPPGA
ncbi:MAG: hypothetical protein WBF65_11605, partial [Sphingopyxis granuli]